MIQTWSYGIADQNMSEDILTDLPEIVRRHPWWRARARLTIALLRRHGIHSPADVLDAGCGWGVTLEALESSGYHAAGLDISRRCLQKLDRPNRRLIVADLTQPIAGDDAPADAVVALDVIEHLDDDHAAVRNLTRLVKPGGILIVSVPALPELFSEFDVVQGHRRRYSAAALQAACTQDELEILQMSWWGSWMVPLLRRRKSKNYCATGGTPAQVYRRYLSLPPWPAPIALSVAYRMEHGRTLRGATRTGTSLFCICRRRQHPGLTRSCIASAAA